MKLLIQAQLNKSVVLSTMMSGSQVFEKGLTTDRGWMGADTGGRGLVGSFASPLLEA